MAARFGDCRKHAPVTEAEELEFRYRSLVAAERILERQSQPGGGSAALRTDRLRHLRQYIRKAIATVERQMKELGIAPPPLDQIDSPPGQSPSRPQENPPFLVREG